MALENATYTFYTETLKRSEVPDETTFNKYAFENKLYMQQLLDEETVTEKATDGASSAVCMMTEVDYKAARIQSGEDLPESSESIAGYSHSTDVHAYDRAIDLNMKSTSAEKYKWLQIYCNVSNGTR
jgi:hypothetical protein